MSIPEKAIGPFSEPFEPHRETWRADAEAVLRAALDPTEENVRAVLGGDDHDKETP